MGARHELGMLSTETRQEFESHIWNYLQTYGKIMSGSYRSAAREIYGNSKRSIDKTLEGYGLSPRQKLAMVEAELKKLVSMGRLKNEVMYFKPVTV